MGNMGDKGDMGNMGNEPHGLQRDQRDAQHEPQLNQDRRFHHYLYVLECADGSLYTGYAADVAARVAAHQSGKGAKYTKSHGPVSLLAQARFFTKERAMSAEAFFKKLSRDDKDKLLAKAAKEPFEDVLRRELPGFGDDTTAEFLAREFAREQDLGYGAFQCRLMPTVDPRLVLGVRTPALRKLAKQAAKRDDVTAFMRSLPHRYFEENQVHAFLIGHEKDYRTALRLFDRFLPHVDNWATCDQLPNKVLLQDPAATLAKVEGWLASGRCYTIRFGIRALMSLFLDDLFEPRFPEMVAAARMPSSPDSPAANAGASPGTSPASGASNDDVYYVDMMRAWYFAEALAHQEAAILPYLETRGNGKDDGKSNGKANGERDAAASITALDEWTRRKAIQKAIESYKISPEMKAHLRSCR